MRMKLLALMLLAIALVIAGCAQTGKEVKQTPTPEKTPTSEATPTEQMTRYASLKEIAEKIRSGEIDVGNNYDMTLEGRFHKIHAKVLGLDCTACHIPDYAKDVLYERKYKKPEGAPGVVDRGVCLGCHKEGGIATPWYGQASE